jgi:hypothetical protein
MKGGKAISGFILESLLLMGAAAGSAQTTRLEIRRDIRKIGIDNREIRADKRDVRRDTRDLGRNLVGRRLDIRELRRNLWRR